MELEPTETLPAPTTPPGELPGSMTGVTPRAPIDPRLVTEPGRVEGAESPALSMTPAPLPRLPKRRRSFNVDSDKVVKDCIDWYNQDLSDRAEWADRRTQRYAKMRGWLETKNYPWPNASNAHIPSIMNDVQSTLDTLMNAVLAVRPPISAIAEHAIDAEKADQVDNLIDYQMFTENNAEEKLAVMADGFVVDGTSIAYIPHVKEEQSVYTPYRFPTPEGDFVQFALEQMQLVYDEGAEVTPVDSESPYSWDVLTVDNNQQPFKATVEFYTEDNQVLMLAKRRTKTFDGPCLLPVQLEDIVVPTRCENLQPRTISNPHGAGHVTMVDYPSVDEIVRLQRTGYYDLLTKKDVDALTNDEGGTVHSGSTTGGMDPHAQKEIKDEVTGVSHGSGESTRDTLTRLTVFCGYDVNDDGMKEEAQFVVLLEPRKLVRTRFLTEAFPANPPRRPFAEARYIPVPGQFYGIGLPELMEHVYDLMKIVFDQMIDSGTLSNTPWGLYRSTSGMRPEIIRMAAGELYPSTDPKNDIHFPQMPQGGQAFAVNTITLLQQWQEKATMKGDLQLGRVPQGKASALRTASTTQSILQQGDARPERILRRFFRGLAEIWQQFHELNQAFLSPGKEYRIISAMDKGSDPYAKLDDPKQIRGRFQFDFKANALNTDKANHAQTLQEMMGISISPLFIQMGITKPEDIYTHTRDLYKAKGLDPDKYIHRPTPQAGLPQVTWHEAVLQIMNGMMPTGNPAEGAQGHFEALQQFHQSAEFGYLSEGGAALFNVYLQNIAQAMQQELQQQQMMAAVAEQQKAMGGQPQQPQGAPGATGMGANAMLQPNEILDKTMPTSGGGSNPNPQ